MATAAITVFAAPEWVQSNRSDFKPPVCNKCMFNDQQKVFFVGGPNQRKDYHLELGEELFYQVEGDMLLKIVEKGEQHKDVPIKQGELFLLPARVEHSPQRFENTVGCVVERTRLPNELDCIRYFVDDSTKVLWERWFHLDDVVKDLPPVIKEFQQSEENKTGTPKQLSQPPADSFTSDATVSVQRPIVLSEFIDEHLEAINTKAPFPVYGPPTYKSQVLLYGQGKHDLSSDDSEDTIVMSARGEIKLKGNGTETFTLGPFHMARVRPSNQFTLDIPDGAVCITVKVG